MDTQSVSFTQVNQLTKSLKRHTQMFYWGIIGIGVSLLILFANILQKMVLQEITVFCLVLVGASFTLMLVAYYERHEDLRASMELRVLLIGRGLKEGWSPDEAGVFWQLAFNDHSLRSQKVLTSLAEMKVKGTKVLESLDKSDIKVLQAYYR